MNVDQKLTAIRDLIQQDVGNRGLARDPARNLINACPDDFANACASIAQHPNSKLEIVTGFFIPSADPPAFETDGPLGAFFVFEALNRLGIALVLTAESRPMLAFSKAHLTFQSGHKMQVVILRPRSTLRQDFFSNRLPSQVDASEKRPAFRAASTRTGVTHRIALERVGPNYTVEEMRCRSTTGDAELAAFTACIPMERRGRCWSMRGHDVTDDMSPVEDLFERGCGHMPSCVTIGIGDGGNEIGMGRIPWDTIRRNIPNGELIACRVPTDHLIVAGVSNWGAYALAAGVALLRGVELPAELFDPDREREILQVMVDAGPLVDGVTGKQQATVDGLSWDDYIKPLVEIGKIVRS
jgi:D-glutamate cyclase